MLIIYYSELMTLRGSRAYEAEARLVWEYAYVCPTCIIEEISIGNHMILVTPAGQLRALYKANPAYGKPFWF
jgi:hypothetical protein